jgi:hypothetical protein
MANPRAPEPAKITAPSAPRKTARVPRSQRHTAMREFSLEPDVDAALTAHCKATGVTRSAFANLGLRLVLGSPVPGMTPSVRRNVEAALASGKRR